MKKKPKAPSQKEKSFPLGTTHATGFKCFAKRKLHAIS